MINFFKDYIYQYRHNEVISIPLYDKHAWKHFVRKSCVSYKQYNDLNMICSFVHNLTANLEDCCVNKIRFVFLEGKVYEKWARKNHVPSKSFSSHIQYINGLQDITVNTLWQKYKYKDIYNIGFLLVKEEGVVGPYVTHYDIKDTSEVLSILFSTKEFKHISVSLYPYILPLALVPNTLDIIQNDIRAFSDSIFAPSFHDISEQEVDFGEEMCDDGIVYAIPVRIAPPSLSAQVDIDMFSPNKHSLDISNIRNSVETLLKDVCRRFTLFDDRIILLDELMSTMKDAADNTNIELTEN